MYGEADEVVGAKVEKALSEGLKVRRKTPMQEQILTFFNLPPPLHRSLAASVRPWQIARRYAEARAALVLRARTHNLYFMHRAAL